ncbi:uncharacterized protein BYT42DRAFT_570712 [Radiomyces spectabilis]|uniref:uncharacterized protein n=1 Tax=Radiomyces spectabilis TaxID=64574 RepID=UPI002220A4A3|nr:uncharacterized protein BYT42DRAFT_570712 [Radiomyces spectabilis]KAI8377558.1 hypothetical protein BYT42DRAFT_570712 [Radiomyces spectabilis]
MAPKGNAKKQNKNWKKKDESVTPVTSDPRFARIHNDPRFLRPKKKDTKVNIDKRFASMLSSKEFSSGPKVDRYGRKLDSENAAKELQRFYHLEDNDESDQESGSESDDNKSLEELERELAADEGNLEDEESDEEVAVATKRYDPMRGQGVISSGESSDEEIDEEEEEEESSEEEQVKTIAEGEESRRLALVNMDWDKIKAVDILKVLNGFKPSNSVIHSVTIYPSEFGKERLKQEDLEGPPKDIFKDNKNADDSDDEEVTEKSIIKNQVEEGDNSEFDQEALRKYQIERLKYYYAVIDCDSVQTAKTIYKACDGTEYESSANFFDLRYIPDDMEFDDEPKESCTHAPEDHKPANFSTEALQHTRVKLTWDQDDPDRIQLMRREFTTDDLKDLDFEAYLASSSDEEEEEEDVDALREKYRKLLKSGNSSAFDDKTEADEDGEEGDMEITFTPGLSEAAGQAVNDKLHGDDEEHEETTIEKYMRKQRERRKAKKERQMNNDEAMESAESEEDEEMKNDPFFRDTLKEMEDEGLVESKDKKEKKDKKKKKSKLSKEERLEQARQKAELSLLMDDAEGKGDGFDMKEVIRREKMEMRKGKKAKKGKKMQVEQDDFEINVNDPRFSAMQESHHFAIDPTNPHFKKTKSMKKLIEARQSKMRTDDKQVDEWKKEGQAKSKQATEDKPAQKDSSLSALVDAVKRKGALSQSKMGKRQKM